MLLLLNCTLQHCFYSYSGYIGNLIKYLLFEGISNQNIFNQTGIPKIVIKPPVVWKTCAVILNCDFSLINRNIHELAMHVENVKTELFIWVWGHCNGDPLQHIRSTKISYLFSLSWIFEKFNCSAMFVGFFVLAFCINEYNCVYKCRIPLIQTHIFEH